MNIGRTYVIILCSSLVFLFMAPSFLATFTMEQPILTEGDFWTYELGTIESDGTKTVAGEERIEVGGTTTITDGHGQQVSARIVTETREVRVESDQGEEKLSTVTTTYYYDESSLGIIEQVTEGPDMTGELIGSFNPPYWTVEWPLSVGNEWTVNSNNTWTIYTGERNSQPVNSSGICRNETEITTPAGTFSCLEVQSWPQRQDMDKYDLLYFSQETGFQPVRNEKHYGANAYSTVVYMELQEFHCGEYGTSPHTPGFEILLAFGILLGFLVWRKKREQKNG